MSKLIYTLVIIDIGKSVNTFVQSEFYFGVKSNIFSKVNG